MNKVNYILLFLLFMSIKAAAQDFRLVGSSSSIYSITLPPAASPWLIPNDGTTPPVAGTAATAAFVEFGDGTFSFLPNGIHPFRTTTIPNNNKLTTKTSRVYGGGGKPPAYQAASIPGVLSYVAYQPMNILLPGEKLAITPNIGSIVAKDTMIFVLTYKMAEGEVNKSLLFLFNDIAGVNVFENVSIGMAMLNDPVTAQHTNFVRMYSGESEASISSGSRVDAVRNLNKKYSNALAINNLPKDTFEHNVFITLIPRDGLVANDLSETLVKAYIVGDTKNTLDTISRTATLPILNLSHDPNYITVKPVCMTLPKAGKNLQYHVHFQNTGPGPAPRVRVAVKVPGNVDLITDITYPPCSAHPIDFYKLPQGNLASTCSLPFTNLKGDSLVFEFEKGSFHCTLDGMSSTPACMSDSKTMGDFWFTIKTNSQMPDLLLAQASIVFYNPPTSLVLANDPILTNVAVSQFRECCDCNKSCDPCKKRRGLWKWLFCKKC